MVVMQDANATRYAQAREPRASARGGNASKLRSNNDLRKVFDFTGRACKIGSYGKGFRQGTRSRGKRASVVSPRNTSGAGLPFPSNPCSGTVRRKKRCTMRRAAMVPGRERFCGLTFSGLMEVILPTVVFATFFVTANGQAHGDIIVRPQHAITSQPLGVDADFPVGWGNGSWMANGSTVTELYLTPELLFNKPVNIGDIASVSFYTKKGTTHSFSAPDWFFTIYTSPFPNSSSWYGYRINSEPYFSENINDPANQWNLWSSDQGSNWLRFFVSGKAGAFVSNGAYTDPHLDAFKLLPSDRGTGLEMADEPIKYFRMATASGWANGFWGQIDGLTITLTDNTSARVNFEPVPEPASMVALGGLGLVGAGWGFVRRRKLRGKLRGKA